MKIIRTDNRYLRDEVRIVVSPEDAEQYCQLNQLLRVDLLQAKHGGDLLTETLTKYTPY